MPVYPKPDLLPAWTKPENASVLDPWYRAPLRTMVSLLGLDDPQSIMALGVPLETGAMTGGVVEALAAKFPRVAQVIKAYHGSAADFDAFDTAKIGTGEGALAYGHGLYVAENPEVATDYRWKLGDRAGQQPEWRLHGEPVVPGGPHDRLADVLSNGPLPEPGADMASTIRQRVQWFREQGDHLKREFGPEWPDTYHADADYLAGLDTTGLTFHPPGTMYEVGVKAHPDAFLDWDRRLSQQSEPVRQALGPQIATVRQRFINEASAGHAATAADLAHYAAQADAIIGRMRGEDLYRALAQTSGKPAASEALRSAGVPGIKYFDGSSRAAGEGSRNYVVFDAATLEILKKYGILLPVAGLGAAEAGKAQE